MACENGVSWCKGTGGPGNKCLKCAKDPKGTKGTPQATTRPVVTAPVTKPAFTAVTIAWPGLPSGLTVTKLLGEGSYKTAYTTTQPGKVLISLAPDKRSLLESEHKNLKRLKTGGVRVVEVDDDIVEFDLGGGKCIGVLMEELDGTEIKETTFGLSKTKEAVKHAAAGYGVPRVIAQLEAVVAFIAKWKGISDLQFRASATKGLVLFDPAALDVAEMNKGPQQMIDYLKKT